MLGRPIFWSTGVVIAPAMMLGCGGAETHIRVMAVTIEGEALPDLEVTALPFDPDRLLDSLAAAAESPAPTFPDLEAEIAGYRPPQGRELSGVGTTWRATFDSVQSLAESLRTRSPAEPGYAEGYASLRELYRRLALRAAERESEFEERFGEDRSLALRAAIAADSLRAWERVAFADFSALADSEVARSGRRWHSGVTDRDGAVELELDPGAWWLIARSPDPANPFLEHYWNVPLVVRAIGPSVVPLHEENAVARWRH